MDSIRPDHLTRTASRHPLAWVPTLYLAQGLPFYSVALVAGLMFKSMGVPNEQIARWTGVIGLAWVFKALWSPFLELAASKKRVVVVLQVTGGVALAALALVLQLPAWFALAIGLLAIVALAGAWAYGWRWLDPAMGVAGAVLVALWARRLMQETGKVLLDREMDHAVVAEIREVIEVAARGDTPRVVDLHVWRVGKAVYACALSVVSRDAALTPAELRARIAEHEEVVHSTIEIIRR